MKDFNDNKLLPADNPALFSKFQYENPYFTDPITPDFLIQVGNGWLAGTDKGEFGGELAYLQDDGTKKILLRANIHNIHRWEDDFLVTTGLAHLSSNSGELYKLSMGADGQWDTQMWRKLPGAPTSSRKMETGELLVNVHGGSILIDAQGGDEDGPLSGTLINPRDCCTATPGRSPSAGEVFALA